MKLATWNINSIRARTPRFLAWLERELPDVLCLQETKVEDAAFPVEALRLAGYEVATFGQPSYNGVAIAVRGVAITDVTRGFGDGGEGDDEARVIAATVALGGGIRIVSCYVPNGQDLTSDRFPYKLAWFGRLRAFLARQGALPLVVSGDMNVTRDDLDVWSPEAWAGKIHCSAPEREAFTALDGVPLVDVFRQHVPEGQVYSWWDYRGVALFKNQGLRIDYVLASPALAARCTSASIDKAARKGQDASDHAPVIATFEL